MTSADAQIVVRPGIFDPPAVVGDRLRSRDIRSNEAVLDGVLVAGDRDSVGVVPADQHGESFAAGVFADCAPLAFEKNSFVMVTQRTGSSGVGADATPKDDRTAA